MQLRECSFQNGAVIDWMTVTFLPSNPVSHMGLTLLNWLRRLTTDRQGRTVQLVGEDCPGMRGYAEGIRIYAMILLDDGYKHVNIGRVDWGGDNRKGRARFDLSGSGCSLIKDWQAVYDELESWDQVTLTRVDLAVDCLDGEFTVDDAAQWLADGEFHAGGRIPKHSTPGDWLTKDENGNPAPVYGRTLEIGRRVNGKMLRAYEKGRQLGDQSSPWTRFEVEIRNKDRDLPLDILINRDTYFTGAYACLERILTAAATRIKTDQAEGLIAIEKLIDCGRTAYGGLVHVLRMTLTADQIVNLMSRPALPARLDRASLAGIPQFGDALRKTLGDLYGDE